MALTATHFKKHTTSNLPKADRQVLAQNCKMEFTDI